MGAGKAGMRRDPQACRHAALERRFSKQDREKSARHRVRSRNSASIAAPRKVSITSSSARVTGSGHGKSSTTRGGSGSRRDVRPRLRCRGSAAGSSVLKVAPRPVTGAPAGGDFSDVLGPATAPDVIRAGRDAREVRAAGGAEGLYATKHVKSHADRQPTHPELAVGQRGAVSSPSPVRHDASAREGSRTAV